MRSYHLYRESQAPAYPYAIEYNNPAAPSYQYQREGGQNARPLPLTESRPPCFDAGAKQNPGVPIPPAITNITNDNARTPFLTSNEHAPSTGITNRSLPEHRSRLERVHAGNFYYNSLVNTHHSRNHSASKASDSDELPEHLQDSIRDLLSSPEPPNTPKKLESTINMVQNMSFGPSVNITQTISVVSPIDKILSAVPGMGLRQNGISVRQNMSVTSSPAYNEQRQVAVVNNAQEGQSTVPMRSSPAGAVSLRSGDVGGSSPQHFGLQGRSSGSANDYITDNYIIDEDTYIDDEAAYIPDEGAYIDEYSCSSDYHDEGAQNDTAYFGGLTDPNCLVLPTSFSTDGSLVIADLGLENGKYLDTDDIVYIGPTLMEKKIMVQKLLNQLLHPVDLARADIHSLCTNFKMHGIKFPGICGFFSRMLEYCEHEKKLHSFSNKSLHGTFHAVYLNFIKRAELTDAVNFLEIIGGVPTLDYLKNRIVSRIITKFFCGRNWIQILRMLRPDRLINKEAVFEMIIRHGQKPDSAKTHVFVNLFSAVKNLISRIKALSELMKIGYLNTESHLLFSETIKKSGNSFYCEYVLGYAFHIIRMIKHTPKIDVMPYLELYKSCVFKDLHQRLSCLTAPTMNESCLYGFHFYFCKIVKDATGEDLESTAVISAPPKVKDCASIAINVLQIVVQVEGSSIHKHFDNMLMHLIERDIAAYSENTKFRVYSILERVIRHMILVFIPPSIIYSKYLNGHKTFSDMVIVSYFDKLCRKTLNKRITSMPDDELMSERIKCVKGLMNVQTASAVSNFTERYWNNFNVMATDDSYRQLILDFIGEFSQMTFYLSLSALKGEIVKSLSDSLRTIFEARAYQKKLLEKYGSLARAMKLKNNIIFRGVNFENHGKLSEVKCLMSFEELFTLNEVVGPNKFLKRCYRYK